MPEYGINVHGVNRVQNSLRKLVSAHSQILDPVVRQWAQSTRGKLKANPYPPRPAGSTYIRTGRLASSFAVENQGTAKVRINNSAKYASFVIGDPQAWMHRGRWWRMAPFIDQDLPELRAAIEKALDEI